MTKASVSLPLRGEVNSLPIHRESRFPALALLTFGTRCFSVVGDTLCIVGGLVASPASAHWMLV